MKLTANRNELLRMTQAAKLAMSGKVTNSAMGCVKITANDDSMTVYGMSGESAIEMMSRQIEVAEPGSALIPANILINILKTLDTPTVVITCDESSFVTNINTGQDIFKLNGQKPDTLPTTDWPTAEGVPVKTDEFTRRFNQVAWCCANDNSRYAIAGVMIEDSVMAATDGRCLAVSKSDDRFVTKRVIVPKQIIGMIKQANTPNEIYLNPHQSGSLYVLGDGIKIKMNCFEGNFPPYKDVIPSNTTISATVHRSQLTLANERARLMTSVESRSVIYNFDGEKLHIDSVTPEIGEAHLSIDVENYEGEKISIGVNPIFVSLSMANMEDDFVELSMSKPNKPIKVVDNMGLTVVVMPVNVGTK